MKINGMNSAMLSVGQQLIVPGNASTILYYVENGDTLNSIASKFRVTIDEIKSKNNLNTDDIVTGQLLKI